MVMYGIKKLEVIKNKEENKMTDKKYFYGNEISQYGIENGYVDYRALAESFDAVLNNDIMQKTYNIGYWEQVNGFIDNSEKINENENKINFLEEVKDWLKDKYETATNKNLIDKLIDKADDKQNELQDDNAELEREQDEQPEIFQYYIVSDSGADILKRETNEILFYNNELDMYIWGVTHWGTSWDYVLTDINIKKFENRWK